MSKSGDINPRNMYSFLCLLLQLILQRSFIMAFPFRYVIYPVFITLSFVCVSVLVCADECIFTCEGVQGYLQVLVHMSVHICRGLKWVVEYLPKPVTLYFYLIDAIFLNEPGARL